MESWTTFAREAPELAAAVRTCFAVRKHATMATLRADGSPRISGTEVELGDDLVLGSMPGARKARDLQRDPRVAVHSPTVDPPEDDPAGWAGEAKVAGVARETPLPEGAEGHRFVVLLTEVSHVRVAPGGQELEISSWHPGRGVEVVRRA